MLNPSLPQDIFSTRFLGYYNLFLLLSCVDIITSSNEFPKDSTYQLRSATDTIRHDFVGLGPSSISQACGEPGTAVARATLLLPCLLPYRTVTGPGSHQAQSNRYNTHVFVPYSRFFSFFSLHICCQSLATAVISNQTEQATAFLFSTLPIDRPAPFL